MKATDTEYRLGVAPRPLPLAGHALRLWRRPLEFLTELPSHGDLVEFRLGPRRAYIACHPEVVQQVLLDSRTFDKGGPLFEKARLLVGYGLVSSMFEEHKRQRRLVQPVFHRARMAGYAAMMRTEIERLTSSWKDGERIDVNAISHALTLKITARTLFATEVGTRAVREVEECMPIIMRGVYKRMTDPTGLVEKLPTRSNRDFDRTRGRMHEVIHETIGDYRAVGTDQGDMLSTLVSARDEETGEGLRDEEIYDQVMTVLIGGTETTGNTLAWTFHILAEHPEIEERLHAEVDDVLGGRLPEFGDLPRLDYTRRVLEETLRMYPPAWLLTRTTTRDVVLCGQRITKGTPVFFSSYMLGRNAELFPDPDRYDPDRWLPERSAELPRGAVVPFGGGKRKCIGDDFGMIETILTLASVAARWRLRSVPGTRISTVPKASLGPGPLLMTPETRRPVTAGVAR